MSARMRPQFIEEVIQAIALAMGDSSWFVLLVIAIITASVKSST